MTRTPTTAGLGRAARIAALALFALAGCRSLLSRTPPPRPGPARMRYDVVHILDVEEPDPAYYRRRARLEVAGPELDTLLAGVAADASLGDNVRANAATLIADRGGPRATAVLGRLLTSRGSEEVRAAAAAALQRFATDSPAVKTALRTALTDGSERVRLAALQGMDVEDARYIRALLPREESRQVRTVAQQLVTLFEARGAPLMPDARGDLRTTADDTVPRIVFHTATADSAARTRTGALWVAMPGGRSLLPLAQRVDVVNDVVPAFFDPQRRVVVFEGDGQVSVRNLRSGATRSFGPGIAPRPIPFTDQFAFLREVPGSRRQNGEATEMDYTVLRAPFAGGAAQEVGTLHATARRGRFGGASPVRTVVVGESSEGFVLRGEGVSTFVLPGPYGQ
jgi:hypothetical protein